MARTRKEISPEVDIQESETNIQDTVEKQTVKEVKVKKTFTDSDYILCKSVWFGGLSVTCPSGNCYEFARYGSECEINYRDLVALIRKGSDHIFTPRFVIMDDDLLDDFPTVRRAYEAMYTTADLQNILKLPTAQMKAEINKLPEATKAVLCKMIASEIASGRLDSIRKVRVLSEMFNSDFNLLSELFVR